MSIVTAQEVKKIASLARLELSESEIASAAKTMSSVLEHFSSIKDIDTKEQESAEVIGDAKNVMREDVVGLSPLASPEELLARAPRTKDGYVEVPGVFSDTVP